MIAFVNRLGAIFAIILVGLVVLGVLIYGAIRLMTRLFVRVSGLAELTRRYATDRPPNGPMYAGQTVQLGAVRWRRCVTIGLDPQGLYIALQATFAAPRPILIPWADVRLARETRLYWQRAFVLNVGTPPVAAITVLGNLFGGIWPHIAAAQAAPAQ